MVAIPKTLKPTWRVVQVFKIVEGVSLGLGLFIASPYYYQIFNKFGSPSQALFYTVCLVAVNFGLIALFEIPTGAIADTFGRVRTIVLSLAISSINGVFVILLFFIENIPLVILLAFITRVLSALTFTLKSGTFSAWLVDSIREREPGFGYDRLLARGQVLQDTSIVVGGLLGVTTYLYGAPYIAFLVMTLLSMGCLSYCLSSMEESQSLVFFNVKSNLWQLMRTHTVKTIKIAVQLCRTNKLIQWFTIAFVGYTFLFNIVDRLWPVALGGQFGIQKWSYQWYAMVMIIPLCSAMAAHLLARRGDKANEKKAKNSMAGLRHWLFSCIYLSALAILFLGWANRQGIINFPVFLISILVVEASFGIVKPAFESLVCHYMPEEHAQERATILSVGSALRSVLVFIFIIPSRGVSDAMSPVGWMLPASILLVIGVVSHFYIRRYQKRNLSVSSTVFAKEKIYGSEPATK
ncbi:MAG: hypothetical protein A3H42_00930 [Deltaproteobacteria bacterium RIFCSPLOWO2_02_FULL_46_8]|nr:MAG: hypothetical protein A3H42_00930 [Deltaproteobacteria bacterium RIFCSPLOWO2_02_FULL_46_8]